MKVLIALTYYHPHLSGLTVYGKRLAEALAIKGHEVTVLCSQHHESLPSLEILNGVFIKRVPVSFFIHKGAVMPSYLKAFAPLFRNNDILSLHLPNTPMEALSVLLTAARIPSKPIIATYHCDLKLPKGVLNRLADFFVFLGNISAGVVSSRIVAHTADYAQHSKFLKLFKGRLDIIPPPIIMPQPQLEDTLLFRSRHASKKESLIGFAARFATEKGIEYLLGAIPLISESLNNFKIIFVGECQNVIGEHKYRKHLEPLLDKYRDYLSFAGVLSQEDMPLFFSACDIVVLPSVNSTESFGMVQVESMLCGTPVVTTNIPGVRVPVRETKMGRIVHPKDSEALASAIIDVIMNRDKYVFPKSHIEEYYSLERTTETYENLFKTVIRNHGKY